MSNALRVGRSWSIRFLIIFALAFGMTLQQTRQAEAFLPAAPLVAPAIGGLLEGTGGAAAGAAVAAGPIGWAVAAGVVVGLGAWWLYSNQDEVGQWWSDKFGGDPDGSAGFGTGVHVSPGQYTASAPGGASGAHLFKIISAADYSTLSGSTKAWPAGEFYWGPGTSGRAAQVFVQLDAYTGCRQPGGLVMQRTNNIMNPGVNGGLYPPVAWGPETQFAACAASGGAPEYFSFVVHGQTDDPLVEWKAGQTAQASKNYATQKCLKADGTEFTVTGPTTTSDTQPAEVTIPSCGAVDPGSMGTKIEIFNKSKDGPDPLKKDAGVTIDPSKLKPGGQFEECGPGHEPCVLAVRYRGVECQIGMFGCPDWYSKIGTIYQTDYECYWGPYEVALRGCAVLRWQYYVDAPRDNHQIGITDPVIGGDPSADPSTDPSTEPDPRSGENPSLGDLPAVDPRDINGCISAGWGWNPVDWVFVPVRCVLTWAFVPEDGYVDSKQSQLESDYVSTRLPEWGAWLGSVGTAFGSFGDVEGCAGPHFEFTLSGHVYAFDPLDACHDPMQHVAVVIKLFATVFVIIIGVRMVIRPITYAFGIGGVADGGDGQGVK